MVVGALLILVPALLLFVLDFFVVSVQERILIAENEELQSQIASVDGRIASITTRLEDVETRDQELYRILLDVDDIPDAVRQVGVGGSVQSAEFANLRPPVATVLRSMKERIDLLDRKVNLQKTSMQEIWLLAQAHEARNRQLPVVTPSEGVLSSCFGNRSHPIHKVDMIHEGIDIAIPMGTPVQATGDGIVVTAARLEYGYGIHVIVDHPEAGYQTVYAHLSSIMPDLSPGQSIKRWDTVGLSGNTGLSARPHLHYEILDSTGTPIDPLPFIAAGMSAEEYQHFTNRRRCR